MAPRKRSPQHEWLKEYPGLHVFPDGRFYVVHPVTGLKASLGTRDRQTALALYARLRARWEPEKVDAVANALLGRLDSIATARQPEADLSFAEYARQWRENVLGVTVSAGGRITMGKTKLVKKGGKPIGELTQRGYGQQCRQIEVAEGAQFRLSDPNLLQCTRRLLATWADTPTHYNHMLAVVSHIYRAAIRDGIASIDRNPATDIEKMRTGKREVYIPDADYVKITGVLLRHQHMGTEEDGEWRARICDLLYMLSARPGDPFKLTEKNLRLPVVDLSAPEEDRDFGSISFGHAKTAQDQIIDMNSDMREVVEWLLAFKRRYRIFNQHLLCYPPYMGRNAGKPVSHRQMWQYFHDAVIEAGFPKGKYRLQDLRKKGLTDEFVHQGENDKGGHKGQAMKDYYRLITPPKRARNTLVDLRKVAGK